MDNKALVVTLVVVFVGGLVLGSASFGGFSGRAVTGTARLSVNPSTVNHGGVVDINIVPNGYDCRFYVYRVNSAGVAVRVDWVEYDRSSGRTCTQPTTYKYAIPQGYRGAYEVRIWPTAADIGSNNYAYTTFSVI